jgi:hypothetical protein
MTNFERLKEITTVEDMAHFLCDNMDYLGDDKTNSCGICPVKDKCLAAEMCGNGWFHWLREEAQE